MIEFRLVSWFDIERNKKIIFKDRTNRDLISVQEQFEDGKHVRTCCQASSILEGLKYETVLEKKIIKNQFCFAWEEQIIRARIR